MGKVYMEGIDISAWNGNIDLKHYKNKFIIIRIGYSTTLDNKAKRNMDECEKLGIPYGVYLYSYALNVAQAKKEAKFVLKLIKGRKIKVGVWFDMEDADGYKKKNGMPSNDTITNMCNEFCEIIKDAGYYVGVYASESWFKSKIKSSMKYPKWVASWGSNDGIRQNDKSSIGPLHQYTSKPLDKNVMYVPISTFVGGKKLESKQSVKKKSIEEIVKEVANGKWGNGANRKKMLEAAGYNYITIQKKVNELLKSKKVKSTYEIAKEVIAGKWGNGNERKRKLENAGYDYNIIQEMVNKLLK